MTLKPTKGLRGQECATATCDECGGTATVTAAHDNRKNFQRGGTPILRLQNEGQAITKLQKAGWAVAGKHLSCPDCEANKMRQKPTSEGKFDMVKEASVIAEIRKPTPKQERLIILALEDAYDDQAKRYRGGDTDKTVADMLCDGIMFGWVAEIRERLFGPAGGNEEIELIKAEIAALRKSQDAAIKALTDDTGSKIAALSKRIDAVCIAVGPRARAK